MLYQAELGAKRAFDVGLGKQQLVWESGLAIIANWIARLAMLTEVVAAIQADNVTITGRMDNIANSVHGLKPDKATTTVGGHPLSATCVAAVPSVVSFSCFPCCSSVLSGLLSLLVL